MKHLLTALCSRALIDEISQGTSLIELIDGLNGPIGEDTEGAFPLALDLVTVWAREDPDKGEKGRVRMGVFAPDRSLLQQYLYYDLDLTSAKKARNITKFTGFPFKGIGMHYVVVETEGPDDSWERKAEWPVNVEAVAPVKTSE